MRIALIGYGKMGHAIKEIANERKHEIVTIDPNGVADFKDINAASLKGVDVCIEFTHPQVVLGNIEKLLRLNQKVVIGTTGWLANLTEVKQLVAETSGTLLYSSNFSLGVNIFFKVVENAAKLIDKFDQYDVSGLEFHHNQKADSPSGTAVSLGEILLENIKRKTKLEYNLVDRRISPEELHFTSVRCGQIPGIHEITFDSQADTISLKHTARNRNGFAYGAVLAAEWIKDQSGLFTLEDYINQLLG